MQASKETHPGLRLDRVRGVMQEHLPGLGEALSARLITGGRSNLTYLLSDGHRRWVLRRPPIGSASATTHDMQREFRVVHALTATAIPVARPLLYCEDESVTGAPFAVYEFVKGPVIRFAHDLNGLSQDQVTTLANELITLLADLHCVDFRGIGLATLGRPEGYLRRQIHRFATLWSQHCDRTDTDVMHLKAQLEARCPPESGAALVHGDFRIDNVILVGSDSSKVAAIVDWEMATLGDPLADLGLHLVYRDPRIAPVLGGQPASTEARMPSAEELAARYSARSGRSLRELPFYLALSYFKAAVIAEGIRQRFLAGQTVGTRFSGLDDAASILAEAGLEALGQDRVTGGDS